MGVLEPGFEHLLALSDHHGTFEHACGAQPRREHGYCTDDMARVLVVTTREPDAGDAVRGLAKVAVRFLDEAQAYLGGCRNRMDHTGRWTDAYAFDDCWGRCLWGLGSAAAHSDNGLIRRLAVIQFERAAHGRSTWPRAMAFAAIGAAELLSVDRAWMPPAGGVMLATARTLRSGVMRDFEFLCIVERSGGLVYQAMPSGRQPAGGMR